jgi:hypothetical protein
MNGVTSLEESSYWVPKGDGLFFFGGIVERGTILKVVNKVKGGYEIGIVPYAYPAGLYEILDDSDVPSFIKDFKLVLDKTSVKDLSILPYVDSFWRLIKESKTYKYFPHEVFGITLEENAFVKVVDNKKGFTCFSVIGSYDASTRVPYATFIEDFAPV